MRGSRIAALKWWTDGGYDSSYQAVLNRATTLGYTKPSASQQSLQNQIVLDLKTSGAWDELDIFYVLANDGSQEFATINWKNPSAFQLTMVNSPNWASNQGFNSNGSTSYLNTNYNFSSSAINLSLNDCSFLCYVYNNLGINGASIMGAYNDAAGGSFFTSNPRNGSNQSSSALFETAGVPVANTDSTGVYHGYRNAVNVARVYRNGSLLATSGASSAFILNLNCYACGYNLNGTPSVLDTRVLSILGIGSAMDGLEAEINTTIQNYMTAL